MKNYKYVLVTFGLLVFLLVPFILRNKHHWLELYPAVLLPSGAGKINTANGYVTFGEHNLWGYRKNVLQKIEITDFLGDIPVQNFHPIAEGNFGLAKLERKFKLYKPPITFEAGNKVTHESLAATREWIKERLRGLGYEDSVLVYRKYRSRFDIKNQDLIGQELVDEKIFEL